MKTALYVIMIMAALVTVPILTNVVGAQSVGSDSEQCLESCPWLSPSDSSYDSDHGSYADYSDCMARCENRFRNSVDEDAEVLEEELD